MQKSGPKAALKKMDIVVGLARRFLADSQFSSAQKLVNALIKSGSTHADVGRLVKLMGDQLANDGKMDQAQKYQKVYRARFAQK